MGELGHSLRPHSLRDSFWSQRLDRTCSSAHFPKGPRIPLSSHSKLQMTPPQSGGCDWPGTTAECQSPTRPGLPYVQWRRFPSEATPGLLSGVCRFLAPACHASHLTNLRLRTAERIIAICFPSLAAMPAKEKQASLIPVLITKQGINKCVDGAPALQCFREGERACGPDGLDSRAFSFQTLRLTDLL